MALILLLLLSSALVVSGAPPPAPPPLSGDVLSLLAFKTSLSRDSSNVLSSWNPTGNHCNWYGVACDRISGRVLRLSLPNGGLVGTLTPSIGNLTELKTLSLPHNLFSGEIPSEIVKLRYLETLELQGNNFSGEIPFQIRHLSSLRLLNFSQNSLSGPILDDLIGLRRLEALDLSNNMFSSEIQLSKSLNSCESLHHLKLSNNYLIGNIPADIGKCFNLRTLLIDGNIIEGQIPPEIGLIRRLRVLDVSRNSLTDRIPRELGNCKELSVVVLTNLVDFRSDSAGTGGEFNAFEGGVPEEVMLLPNLQILWAPRANLGGGLGGNWNGSCSLRVLNLGQNYLTGLVPRSLEMCRNLTFLDLSSNGLQGEVPLKLQVPCMVHFNVSRNSLSGSLPSFPNTVCDTSLISYGRDANFLDEEDIRVAYSNIPVWGTQMKTASEDRLLVVHDFSWNDFFGTLPLFSFKNQFFMKATKVSYKLLMNNNRFNGSLPAQLLSSCSDLHSVSANLSVNQVSGALRPDMFLNCLSLTSFEAAQNRIDGSIPPEIGTLKMLQRLDLSRNSLSGAMPVQLGDCKDLEWINLGENNFSGAIPAQLGELTSLRAVLLDHNNLSGEIPSSFSTLPNLSTLDLSFNNLSGRIPHLQQANDCDSYKGNKLLTSCPDSNDSPTGLPTPLEVRRLHNRRKMKFFVIAISTSVSVVFLILAVVVVVLFMGRRKLSRLSSLRRKMVVTFAETPIELNYDNVVGATGNFSIRNLIGTGGFGSTYKAELAPGFLVAVKRLSLGRFQGIQQFEAEIRTVGRIRHNNLVTLIGYYVGEKEMFLVYNYLSGGNLETFIHERSGKNVEWHVIHKIAVDVARSLAFLHYSCVPRIVHRDIKPSNILLDEDCNAYLSDFGLARLLEVSETHATTDVAGTFGYVAPEYATTCRVSDKADVYSFGVVLLELMSGKKSLDPSFSEYGNGFNIVTWAKMLIKEGRYSELFAPQLWESGPKEDLLGMMKLASTCTVESPLSVRPSMKQVFERLKQLSGT